MSTDILTQKAALRRLHLAKRSALSPAERAALDAALCAQIAAHPRFHAARALLAYFPVRDEPDLRALYTLALKEGKHLAFPRCEGKQMRFYGVTALGELSAGRFGIPAPPPSAPLFTPDRHTLCLLPALAATADGSRLGYGGGFYDRFLAEFPCHTLLAIYSALLCNALPCEMTDVRAEIILTEKGVLANVPVDPAAPSL